MGRANKFPGGGRLGDTASGGSKVNGGNGMGGYRDRGSNAPRGSTGPSVTVTDRWSPGTKSVGTSSGMSTHNSISTFLKGAKSRGPYGGPTFASLNNMEHNYKMGTPSSRFSTPSSSGTGRSGMNGGRPDSKRSLGPNKSIGTL